MYWFKQQTLNLENYVLLKSNKFFNALLPKAKSKAALE